MFGGKVLLIWQIINGLPNQNYPYLKSQSIAFWSTYSFAKLSLPNIYTSIHFCQTLLPPNFPAIQYSSLALNAYSKYCS